MARSATISAASIGLRLLFTWTRFFQSPQGIIEELAEECKKVRIEVEGEETLIIPKGFNKANISFFDLPL